MIKPSERNIVEKPDQPRERQNANYDQGATRTSAGFYIGMAVVIAALALGTVVAPSRPLVDQHANPNPAVQLPAQVLSAPGSHLYHASASCPYVHRDSKSLSASAAIDHGLVPCPYCIGNSSARLTPIPNFRRTY